MHQAMLVCKLDTSGSCLRLLQFKRARLRPEAGPPPAGSKPAQEPVSRAKNYMHVLAKGKGKCAAYMHVLGISFAAKVNRSDANEVNM